jgi:AraC family transcriptional regulator of adaptative response/methylated-DNA-[protein]-cysteine methyltransferase
MRIEYSTEAGRWAAVVTRDRRADGAFVLGVRTTGVYCRPGCTSRTPLRRNVEFFDAPAAAERAGYRACLRCKPDRTSPWREAAERIVQACRMLEREEGLETRELARRLGMNAFTLQRSFKQQVGVTPQAYRRRILAERARERIPASRSVSEAVYGAGYSGSSRFYEGVGRELGMPPRQAQAGGRGAEVRYAVRPCSLGTVLLAWTERGACDVRFAGTEAEAVRELRARFPAATAVRSQAPGWVDEVVELIERPRGSDLPLDIQGTAFQQRVWAELRRIPPGQTRSYAQVAAAIGAPSSARAVARACAANRLAVLVPCHRVIGKGGDLSGYRWGTARKRELLQRESAGGDASPRAPVPKSRPDA